MRPYADSRLRCLRDTEPVLAVEALVGKFCTFTLPLHQITKRRQRQKRKQQRGRQTTHNNSGHGTLSRGSNYRLNVASIHIPPLRGRTEDIPLLVQRFLSRSERPVSLREDALELIMSPSWPGNVRELENVVTRAIVLAPGGVITPDCIQSSRLSPTQ